MNWLTSRCAPLAALTALALTSCDTGTALNVDLPDTATVNTQYQDFDVSSSTVRLDSVQSQKTDHFLIGRLADNVAGATMARAFFNIVDVSRADSLPSKFTDPKLFSGTPTLDSTVMIMGFDRVYGSSSTPGRFDVFKLANSLDERQVYTASSSEPGLVRLSENVSSRLDRTKVQTLKAADISVTPNIPAVTTIVPDQTVRLVMQRRAGTVDSHNLPLPLIPQPFLSDDLFAKLRVPGFGQSQLDAALKGLAVAPNATYNSGIVSFGRPNASRMVLYFHSTSAWATRNNKPADTLKRAYAVYFGPAFSSGGLSPSSDPRYYTQITNDLPAALAALNSSAGFVPSTALSGTSYTQEGTGLGTRVTFTGLDALTKAAAAGSGVTINRAELRVPVKPYSTVLFSLPSQLYAVEVNNANTVLQRIINYLPTNRVVQADGSSPTGAVAPAAGYLTAISAAQTYYTLPITSYLQAYLNNQLGGNPASLVLLADSNPSSPLRLYNTLTLNRAVLDAANIKLRVYYSKR